MLKGKEKESDCDVSAETDKVAGSETLTGKRFGKLLVTGFDRVDGSGHNVWKAVCDCGTELSVTGSNLISGRTRSCGCSRRNDLTGKVFGKLTAVKFHSSCGSRALWLCRCECGKEKVFSADNLRRGRSTHCGCSRRKREAKIVPKLHLFTMFPIREPMLDELADGAYKKILTAKELENHVDQWYRNH